MKRLVAMLGAGVIMSTSVLAMSQPPSDAAPADPVGPPPADPPPKTPVDAPRDSEPRDSEPPVAEPRDSEPPVVEPPVPGSGAPEPSVPPALPAPAPSAPEPPALPPPRWTRPPIGARPGRRAVPPPDVDLGPYYADIAAWSSVLSTLLPMVAGFTVVAVAERGADQEVAMQVAGFSTVGLGLIVGPSVGHLYAADYAWGLGGMAIRLGLIGGGAAFVYGGTSLRNDDRRNAAGPVLLAIGAAAGTAGLGVALLDLIDSPEAARRANREERRHRTGPLPEIGVGAGSMQLTWRN